MNKTAFDLGVEDSIRKHAFVDPVSIATGYYFGKKQQKRKEKHTFGGKQLAATALVPGGAGYQLGRFVAHKTKD